MQKFTQMDYEERDQFVQELIDNFYDSMINSEGNQNKIAEAGYFMACALKEIITRLDSNWVSEGYIAEKLGKALGALEIQLEA